VVRRERHPIRATIFGNGPLSSCPRLMGLTDAAGKAYSIIAFEYAVTNGPRCCCAEDLRIAAGHLSQRRARETINQNSGKTSRRLLAPSSATQCLEREGRAIFFASPPSTEDLMRTTQ